MNYCFSISSSSPQLAFNNRWSFKLPIDKTSKATTVSASQGRSNLSQEKNHDAGNNGLLLPASGDGAVVPIQTGKCECPSATPLVDALKSSAEQNVARFHFPGHNSGRAAPSSLTRLIGSEPFVHDLPELPELDSLFAPSGPILEAQKKASKLFGSSETWFLVGGTTCGVLASIMATCSPGNFLILARNSHMSAISAMVLSGAVPKYILPDYNSIWDIPGGVTPIQVEKALEELGKEGQRTGAVLITSPTYHGICSNLSEISRICHSFGVPLIVDEAHGAHLGFHPEMPSSALQQGADLAVQSTHKVLCSLTQSSMLHLSGNMVDRARVCHCLQMLQSTSPSYLLLASLDAATAQICKNPANVFNGALQLACEAKRSIRRTPGITLLDSTSFKNFHSIDPLRITVGFWELGLSGYEADEYLDANHGIVPEIVGTQSITLALNLGTGRDDVQRLVSGLQGLSEAHSSYVVTKPESAACPHFSEMNMSMNPRDAFFAKKRRVGIEESIGKVCGELICPYPPGIPVIIPGETITEKAVSYLVDLKRKGAVITGASDPSLCTVVVVCVL
ncbi:Arginine decarboxylase [Linum perenne]